MEKQTAVEWLVQQIYGDMWTQDEDIEKLVHKTKELEKQQIIDAFEQGDYTGRGFEDLTSEEYYHINFKSQ
jgi:hypothetical protein